MTESVKEKKFNLEWIVKLLLQNDRKYIREVVELGMDS